jgi:hypothetical protein
MSIKKFDGNVISNLSTKGAKVLLFVLGRILMRLPRTFQVWGTGLRCEAGSSRGGRGSKPAGQLVKEAAGELEAGVNDSDAD